MDKFSQRIGCAVLVPCVQKLAKQTFSVKSLSTRKARQGQARQWSFFCRARSSLLVFKTNITEPITKNHASQQKLWTHHRSLLRTLCSAESKWSETQRPRCFRFSENGSAKDELFPRMSLSGSSVPWGTSDASTTLLRYICPLWDIIGFFVTFLSRRCFVSPFGQLGNFYFILFLE